LRGDTDFGFETRLTHAADLRTILVPGITIN
jgi:hypothetical protein